MAKLSKELSIRRSPFFSLQEELDKAINRVYNLAGFNRAHFENFENLPLFPAVDIIETKDHFKVEVEMPGMSENEIQVSISEGILTIHGEKEVSKKDEGKNYVMREINYGHYERRIPLPDSVDPEKAKASFKKGMLWIDIPKKPESIKKSHTLKVEKISE